MVETHIIGDGSTIPKENDNHTVGFDYFNGTMIPRMAGDSGDRFVHKYLTNDAEGKSGEMFVVEPMRKAGNPTDQAFLSTTYDRYKSEESAFQALAPEVQARITRAQKQIEEHLDDGKWDGVNIDPSRIPEELRGDWKTLSEFQEYLKQPRLKRLLARIVDDVTDI